MLEREENVVAAERRVVWSAWSPAQLVALVFGVLYLILGGVALATAGASADSFTTQHVSVLGFHHTPLLGVLELGFGLLLIVAGAVPGAGRGLMVFLGVLALGFGVVVAAQAASLHSDLGVHDANGWLYIITGVVTIVAAMAAPVIFGRERRTTAYQDDVLRRGRI